MPMEWQRLVDVQTEIVARSVNVGERLWACSTPCYDILGSNIACRELLHDDLIR